ncbi:MAG: hypothetical protein WBP45_05995 [Daejeonella sp.]
MKIPRCWCELDAAQSGKTIQATGLLLAITTLHEFVHFGRHQNQLTSDIYDPITGAKGEAGLTFEANISHNRDTINDTNAIQWINYYPYNF